MRHEETFFFRSHMKLDMYILSFVYLSFVLARPIEEPLPVTHIELSSLLLPLAFAGFSNEQPRPYFGSHNSAYVSLVQYLIP